MRHVATDKMRLFPSEDAAFVPDEPLLWASLGFVSDLEAHIQLVEGEFPADQWARRASPVCEVLVSRKTADLLGLQVGELYTLFATGQVGAQIPVRIAGVWQAGDPSDPFWFYQPDAFDEMLLTSESAFVDQVVPALEAPVATAVWYQIYDGSRVRPATVNGLLENVAVVEARVTVLLNNTTLDVSPVPALQSYGKSASLLTLVLTIFSLPVIGLVAYFISLIAGMVVRRGQSEIAIMRSRGISRRKIVNLYLLEGLLLGGLGLAGGLLLGRWMAQLMSRTHTFLDPAILTRLTGGRADGHRLYAHLSGLRPGGRRPDAGCPTDPGPARLPTLHRHPALGAGPVAAGPGVAALLSGSLSVGAALLRLVPTGQAGHDHPGFGQQRSLFQSAALSGAGAFLFLARLAFPAFLPAADEAPGQAGSLAARHDAPAHAAPTGPLHHAIRRAAAAAHPDGQPGHLYRLDGGHPGQPPVGPGVLPGRRRPEPGRAGRKHRGDGDGHPAGPGDDDRANFGRTSHSGSFCPSASTSMCAGVKAAARVGDYSATANIGGRQQAGQILGIDRVDFPGVAFFRPDFAYNESLGELMNRLAVASDGILVSSSFLTQQGLTVGDPLRLTVGAAGDYAEVSFTIVGSLGLFPTLYPQDGPFFVANLDHIHNALGGTYPYDVWLATDASADSDTIVEGVRDLGLVVVTARDARETIAAEQTRPERQGLFGLLSVGFIAAAVLTVIGFLVYAVVSFQRRFIELGMLRAIGLSTRQMAAYLAGELAVLILTGVTLGAGLGVWASTLFIPYFQVGSDKTALVPPFVVQVAWQQLGVILVIFGAMFVVAVAVLAVLLTRMRVFEAVKLGETV